MEEKNFIDKMHEILKEVNKKYTVIPTILKETFDNLIQQRKQEDVIEKSEEWNDLETMIFLEEDSEKRLLLTYIDGNGERVQILDGTQEYKDLPPGIKVKISTFLHEFERVIKRKEIELIEIANKKQADLFEEVKAGKITLDQFAKSAAQLAQQLLEIKKPEEYLEQVLNYYREEIGNQSVYSMRCAIAEREGEKKGPRVNKTPEREDKEEFELEHKLEGIEKLMPNYDLIVINDGEYYAYVYDLANNQNSEKGYMMIVEPKKNEGISTRVAYLSQREFEKMKERNKEKEDLELKASYLKSILEDREKLEQTARINHREYGKWLAIMNYYLKGTKQIEPEILEEIDDETFKKRFPREYLKDLRENLLDNDGRG